MKRLLIISAALLLAASSVSHADFVLQRKIPAPKACPSAQANKVTGLGWQNVGPGALFVTTQCYGLGWHDYVHLVRPADGVVLFEEEFTFVPPHCGAPGPFLTSGDHVSGDDYVVGDECGEIMWLTFDPDTLYVWDSADPPDIGELSGLVYRGDTLYTVDRDSLDLLAVQVDGYNVIGRYPQPASDPSALAMHNGNVFIFSRDDTAHVYEMTTTGALVDIHNVEGMYGCYPLSAVFVGDFLYVGSVLDSILVFRRSDYIEPIEPGNDVTVEIIPDKVKITFDAVLDSGYVSADVFDEQPCPPPPGVQFVSDFYEITTTSSLQYISQIELSDTSISNEVDLDLLRVFVRQGGPCRTWRDITVDSTEVQPILARLTRTLSEDDEFSLFGLAVDNRDQNAVVEFKFDDLSGHLNSAEDSIPSEAYNQMKDLLVEAHELFDIGHYTTSAQRADSIATVARSYQDIPSVFDPQDRGKNVAGRLIGRAHTLAFSIRFFPGWLAGMQPGTPVPCGFLKVSPNPAGRETEIEYTPMGIGETSIKVYSPTGRSLITLFKGKVTGRPVRVHWNGENEEGRRVAPGIYFVIAREGSGITTRKIVLQR